MSAFNPVTTKQQNLVCVGFSDGWEVCAHLGQCESYPRLSARRELMAFALTHCPPANIPSLLAASSSLQTQVRSRDYNLPECLRSNRKASRTTTGHKFPDVFKEQELVRAFHVQSKDSGSAFLGDFIEDP